MYKENSAGAVVFTIKNNKILYLLLKAKYKSEYWEFPKGLIENTEDALKTVKREVKEETGLENFEIIEGFKEKINYVYRREGKNVYKEVLYYLVEANDLNVRISHEHLGYEWVDYEEARKRLRDKLRLVLDKANQFITERLIKKDKSLLDYLGGMPPAGFEPAIPGSKGRYS